MTSGHYAHLGDERKRQILDAATTVFAEVGYEKASVARIAEQVGLSQAGLLHHYRSKSDLLIAVLAYRDSEAGAQIDLQSPPGGLVILSGLKHLFRAGLARPQIIRLYAKIATEATSTDHPAHAWAVERYAWVQRLYAHAFAMDKDAGLLRESVDPEHIARQLVAVMDGLQLQWLLDPSVDAAGAFDRFVDGLVDCIRA